jgi:hypothetical protein
MLDIGPLADQVTRRNCGKALDARVRLAISSPIWGVHDVADEGVLSGSGCVVDTLSEALSLTWVPLSLMFLALLFICGTLFSDMSMTHEPFSAR